MNDDFDFDYEAPQQTEQPAPAQAVQQPVFNQQIITMPVMPDLRELQVGDIAFGSEYWTPQQAGEFKRGLVMRFETQPYDKIDDRTGEVAQIELRVLIFAEQINGKDWKFYANGGKRLMATVENAVNSGLIIPQKTPVVIKYLGKRKNTTNGFQSDDFEVKPLV
jgi:hypothetical protein